MKCKYCNAEVDSSKQFCQNCGKQLRSPRTPGTQETEEQTELKKKEWPTKLAKLLGIWGFINLIVTSVFVGGILILFSILIYASQNFKAIYAFGIIWLILALIQLIYGAFLLDSYYTEDVTQGIILLVFSLINFGFGGYTIYKTRKFEEINS